MELRIEMPDDKKGKGRVFSARFMGAITAPGYVTGTNDHTRPVWFSYAASEGSFRPFTANLQMGRVATSGGRGRGDEFEFLRSAGYEWSHQTIPGGYVVGTAIIPDAFVVSPDMVDSEIGFVAAPTTEWLDTKRAMLPINSILAHIRKTCDVHEVSDEQLVELIPYAPLFHRYLDGRTGAPLVPDPHFSAQLLVDCVNDGECVFGSEGLQRYSYERSWGVSSSLCYSFPELEMGRPMQMDATHKSFEAVLAKTVQAYFKVKG